MLSRFVLRRQIASVSGGMQIHGRGTGIPVPPLGKSNARPASAYIFTPSSHSLAGSQWGSAGGPPAQDTLLNRGPDLPQRIRNLRIEHDPLLLQNALSMFGVAKTARFLVVYNARDSIRSPDFQQAVELAAKAPPVNYESLEHRQTQRRRNYKLSVTSHLAATKVLLDQPSGVVHHVIRPKVKSGMLPTGEELLKAAESLTTVKTTTGVSKKAVAKARSQSKKLRRLKAKAVGLSKLAIAAESREYEIPVLSQEQFHLRYNILPLIQIAHANAKAGVLSVALLERLLRDVNEIPNPTDFTDVELTKLAWIFAKAHVLNPVAVDRQAVLKMFETIATSANSNDGTRFATFPEPNIAVLAWSFAHADVRHDGIFEEIRRHVRMMGDKFKSEDLVVLMNSFGRQFELIGPQRQLAPVYAYDTGSCVAKLLLDRHERMAVRPPVMLEAVEAFARLGIKEENMLVTFAEYYRNNASKLPPADVERMNAAVAKLGLTLAPRVRAAVHIVAERARQPVFL